MRTLSYIAGFMITAILLPGCEPKNPGYPNTPVISFNSFQGTGTSTAIMKINFTDGDGDLGRSPQDTTTQADLWMEYLYYDTTQKEFVAVYNPNDASTFDTVYYVYHLPDLNQYTKGKAQSGIIEVKMTDWYVPYYADNSLLKVKFRIYLYDRARNKSNVISTRTIYPGSSNP